MTGPFVFSKHQSSVDQDQGETAGPGSDDFHGLRAYHPGDSIRHIAWKAYSGGRGLQTKEFVATVGASVFFDFDMIRESGTEEKLSRLCDLILKANHQSMDYGLRLQEAVIEPDKGEEHKHNCLKALALFA